LVKPPLSLRNEYTERGKKGRGETTVPLFKSHGRKEEKKGGNRFLLHFWGT